MMLPHSQPYVHPKAERLLELQKWSITSTQVSKSDDRTTPTFKRVERAPWGTVIAVVAGTVVVALLAARYAQNKLDEHIPQGE